MTATLMLDISVVNTAISNMASSLHASLSGLRWVVDAYTLPLAATVLTAGALADRGGRRRWFVAGLALFTAASASCGLASDIGTLIASRAVQGLGASIMFATSLWLIAHVSPTRDQRVKALAAYGATIGAAVAIGPFVGGSLTSAFGWRAIFLINVPLGLAAIATALTRVGESRDPHGRGVDVIGQLTLIAGLFGIVFGLLRGNQDGWGSAGIVAALISGAALLGAFAVAELRGRDPMLPLTLLRDRTFAGTQVAVFAISAGFFAILSALPPERSGLAAGANDTFRQAGVALGIAAPGAFVPTSGALGGSRHQFAHGLHQALIAAAALSIAGAVATAALLLQREAAAPTGAAAASAPEAV